MPDQLTPSIRRMTVTAALVAGLLAASAGLGQAHDDHHHDHDPYYGCDDEHPEAIAIQDRVRYALEHVYTDVAVLVASGYHPYFDAVLPGITHWLKPQFIDDGVQLDPLRPESILVDLWNRPVGMMFIEDSWEPGPPVYVNDDGVECYPWHPHYDEPARFGWMWYRAVYDGSAQDGTMEYPDRTPAMMHVWANNPNGTFNAHDYPEASDPPGPMPSYFQDGTVEELARSVFGS